ncbi:MAG: DUF29 domain-containing protein [Methylococcales bacterium]|nr:DUF29 domain-containing protein [Methylococcales bacterium]
MINYEQDFYSWTQEQAALLRSGRLIDLDIDNLIEEIEALGRSEKRELQSRLMVLLVQLLKWKYQPARRGRSWLLTIKGQRMNLEDVINDNPGLKSQLFNLLTHAYPLAKIEAAKQTRLDDGLFDDTCPWSLEQVRDTAFFPD